MNRNKLSEIIVGPGQTIKSVVEHINKNGFRGVFVCDGDQELLGIVTDADIRKATLHNIDIEATVRTIMKTSPISIDVNTPTVEQKKEFIKSNKMLMPIIDEKKRLVGFISLLDVIDDILRLDNLEPGEQNGRILPPQKILVIGGAGYIGSVLVEKLLRIGHKVRVLDLLLYGKESLVQFEDTENFEFVRGDCRDEGLIQEMIEGVDAVVHLGEIVGDPACSVNESFTIETNFMATHMIVEQCIKSKVKRLIFASSCSVYGQNDDEVREDSALSPVSLYARCKIESEKAILSCNFDHFCPTILRLATVHGLSYRQRFDLVVNLLAIKALKENKIQIFGGEQWRPFISVRDICQAIIKVLHAERDQVRNQVFNLGDSRENYQLSELGIILKEILPDIEVETLSDDVDSRNYRVNFDKIKQVLGFTAEYMLRDSVHEIVRAVQQDGKFSDYIDSMYYNIKTLK